METARRVDPPCRKQLVPTTDHVEVQHAGEAGDLLGRERRDEMPGAGQRVAAGPGGRLLGAERHPDHRQRGGAGLESPRQLDHHRDAGGVVVGPRAQGYGVEVGANKEVRVLARVQAGRSGDDVGGLSASRDWKCLALDMKPERRELPRGVIRGAGFGRRPRGPRPDLARQCPDVTERPLDVDRFAAEMNRSWAGRRRDLGLRAARGRGKRQENDPEEISRFVSQKMEIWS